MRNKTISVCLATLALSLGCNLAMAQHGGGFGGGFHGGGGGFHGNSGAHFHANGGQFRGNGGFVGHRGGHFRDFRGRGIFIAGGPFFFDPFFYDGYGYYGNQLIYAQPGINYSFYCRNPEGYYPDVDACPTGWLQIAPDGP